MSKPSAWSREIAALHVRLERGKRSGAVLLGRRTGCGEGGLELRHRRGRAGDRLLQRIERRERPADIGAELDLHLVGHWSPRMKSGRQAPR
jgi:hypothetical protein